MSSISLEIVDIQGYLWLTAYFHYFTPGRLRVQTRVRKVPLYRIRELIDQVPDGMESRRWMMRNESPYPGYCHAPGASECLPVLCNCEYLKQLWLQKWHPAGNETTPTRGHSRLLKNEKPAT